MSQSHASQPSQGPPPKARNPVERMLVWGFIAVLLVLVAIQGVNTWLHSTAVAALQKRVKDADESPSAAEVTEEDVKQVLGSKQPIRTEQYASAGENSPASKKLEVYSWFSLLPTRKLELWVHYGKIGVKEKGVPTVIEISTDDQTAASIEAANPPPPVVGESPSAGPPAGTAGMMPAPPGAGGPSGRGRGRPGAATAEGENADDAKADEKKADDEKAEEKKPESESEKAESKPETKPE